MARAGRMCVAPVTFSHVAITSPAWMSLIVQGAAYGRLRLEEKRAFDQTSSLNSFELNLALLGPETAGLPRAARPLAA